MDNTFTIVTSDGERTLTPVPVITMRIDSAIRRVMMLHENQCADELLKLRAEWGDQADAMSGIHLLNWICDNEEILNDLIRLTFNGNHEGINYYDVDRRYARQLVAFFLIYSFDTGEAKTGDILKSLQSMGVKSHNPRPSKGREPTRSTTKNGRGASRKR